MEQGSVTQTRCIGQQERCNVVLAPLAARRADARGDW